MTAGAAPKGARRYETITFWDDLGIHCPSCGSLTGEDARLSTGPSGGRLFRRADPSASSGQDVAHCITCRCAGGAVYNGNPVEDVLIQMRNHLQFLLIAACLTGAA